MHSPSDFRIQIRPNSFRCTYDKRAICYSKLVTGTKRDGECIFQCQYYPSLRLQTAVLLQVPGRSERVAIGGLEIGLSSSDN